MKLGSGPQTDQAMKAIAETGRGAVVLLRDTAMKLALDEEAHPHKLRQYGLGAQILAALGIGTHIAQRAFAKGMATLAMAQVQQRVIQRTGQLVGTATVFL